MENNNGYYSSNKPMACYGTALANLLIDMNDKDTAKEVFDAYPMHRLVEEDGKMHPGVSTRVLRDITNGLYVATLYIKWDGLEQNVRSYFEEKANEILKVTREETEAGNIKEYPRHLVRTPVLYAIEKENNWGHWVVHSSRSMYIDDGEIKFNPEELTPPIRCMLEVRKVH